MRGGVSGRQHLSLYSFGSPCKAAHESLAGSPTEVEFELQLKVQAPSGSRHVSQLARPFVLRHLVEEMMARSLRHLPLQPLCVPAGGSQLRAADASPLFHVCTRELSGWRRLSTSGVGRD